MNDAPITDWITGTKQGDPDSAEGLWNYYVQRVVRLARSRMAVLHGTIYDEEDAALSAMNSLFRGIHSDRFPELHDRHNLWRILILITKRKLRAQWRRESAQRRGGTGNEEGRPAVGLGRRVDINEVISEEPTPDFVAEMMDEIGQRLGRLGEENMQRIAVMRMEGFTHDEIAARLGCTSRTVRRKLERIRDIWGVAEDA